MNYMKKVAKMLGVELGERFKVSGIEETVYLDKDGLKADGKEWGIFNNVLMCLVTGENEIIKLPRKPKNGETIWFTTTDGAVVNDCFHSRFARDLSLYKLGKLYCTEAEAEAHREEDKAFWDEVRKELEE